ncbi:hypothetical protein [Paenibacillus ehimensis]|uniref:Uncharacterized protein n=1 Tax=Paenibacillus ehimensis TaxID=79264 RepID=A0ABT8VMD5_9BACL|nr:hypothetical protein [Paenibacillus ehimensis]MDO3682136.1 hypothetical protein [Paenibacillus ehimensis]
MDFRIQAGCPQFTGEYDEDISSLSDALEIVFPLWTEDAIIMWKNICIPIGYKYDISLMIEDILNILETLRINHSGKISVHWPTNTFACKWDITWDSNSLTIHSEWECVVGKTEDLLKQSGHVVITKEIFQSEWKRVLRNIIEGLTKSGFNTTSVPKMARLIAEFNAIKNEGILYN